MSEQEIYIEAMNRRDPGDRRRFLDEFCAGNEELRERVERLIQQSDQLGSFLQSSPQSVGVTADISAMHEKPGSQIGPYKLLQPIGEGGMGLVYLAEQTEPVRRKVALKIIKPGMDSRQVITRFEAERQALSLMDHPNIARVLDAGTTEGGRPFFVMELVKGRPITQYCDERHLTPRQRLELLLPVCQAIQHAHQKGIIHRDIKPSNILVAEYDQHPVPKVIDFGVAKAISQPLTEKTNFTGFGQVVGTLEYMSPEQAKLNQLDIDTRSDIYSLGVLLYELLTGTTPFDKQRLRSAAWDEMLRIIREEEPPKPSTRLSDSKDSLPSISAQRQTEPAKLTKLVRGELDWIVMKALEKDRNRRYETAISLAADVQRYLNDEPVLACPPSSLYRFRKFARRNKVAFLTSLGLLLVVVATVVGLVTYSVRIKEEKERTQTALVAEAKQREHAEANFQQALRAVDELLTQVGQQRFSSEPHLEEVRRELLEKALKFYRAFLQDHSDDPTIRLETGMAFRRSGEIEYLLGRYDPAREALQQGIALLEPLVAERPEVAAYRLELGRSHLAMGKLQFTSGAIPNAEPALRAAIALLDTLVAADPQTPENRQDLAISKNALGLVLKNTGRSEEAERTIRESVELLQRLVADFPGQSDYCKDLAKTLVNLANLQIQLGRRQDAEQTYRDAVKEARLAAEKFPSAPDFRNTLGTTLGSLGALLIDKGQLVEAEQTFRDSLEILNKLVAEYPSRPDFRHYLAHSHSSLSIAYVRAGRPADAEASCADAAKIVEQLTIDFPKAADFQSALGAILNNWSNSFRDRGELELAREKLEQAIRHQQIAWDINPKHPEYGDFLGSHYTNLSNILRDLKAPPEQVEQAAQQAIRIMKQLSIDYPRVPEYQSGAGGALHNLARLFQNRGRLDEARQLLVEAIGYQQNALKINPRSINYRQFLGNHYHNLGSVLKELKEPKSEIEDTFRLALVPRQELATEIPTNARFQRDVKDTQKELDQIQSLGSSN